MTANTFSRINVVRERGAALVVALVMLLLITAVAAATMTNSTFLTAITGNVQQREGVFRVAESAVEQTLDLPSTQWMAAETTKASAATLDDELLAVDASHLSSAQTNVDDPTATIRYLEARPYYGTGEQLGEGAPQVKSYEVTGTAESKSGRVATTIVQGISKVVPQAK
jgi:hypothetical protein